MMADTVITYFFGEMTGSADEWRGADAVGSSDEGRAA